MDNQTDKLESLLRSLKAAEGAVPTEHFRTNARIRILNSVTRSAPVVARPVTNPRRRHLFAYAFSGAIFAMVLSTGLVYASQSSIPTQALYPVKVLGERVALTLAPNETVKTTVANSIIGHRIEEVEKAVETANEKALDAGFTNLTRNVREIRRIPNISHEAIEKTIEEHKEIIEKAKTEEKKYERKRRNDRRDRRNDGRQAASPTPEASPSAEIRSDEGSVTPSPTVTPKDEDDDRSDSWDVKGVTRDRYRFRYER